ncbi:MAG: sterol desaturase family protein [Pseudomonadota bacterium]
MHALVRWGSYPLVMAAVIAAQLEVLASALPYWPSAPLIAALGILAVALLERVQPYEPRWNEDHGDTAVDIVHAMTSLTLIFLSAEIVGLAREFMPAATFWPMAWPLWAQVLGAGLILDFGLWYMHWLSHRNRLLWRLHALHHSAERLYWLNGERRHPLSALVLAGPGIAVLTILGAPAAVIGCWFSIVAVHLAFQHANLDYQVGPLRTLLGVAEVHRWHHKREYEDAQVNFGEVFVLWDQVFGTYRLPAAAIRAGEVGMREAMPKTWWQQIRWPFTSG